MAANPDDVPAYSPNDLGILSVNINKKPRRFSLVRTTSTTGATAFLGLCVYLAIMICKTANSPLTMTLDPLPAKIIPNEQVVLHFNTNAGGLKWKSHDKNLHLTPDTDFTRAVVSSGIPGTYIVHAIAAKHGILPYSTDLGNFQDVVIEVIDPNPKPPVPPAPTPVPPAPVVDPFQTTLANAFKTDGSPSADAMALASLLTMGSKGTVNDPAITTLSALFAKLHAAEESLESLPTASPSKLMATRTAIAKELTSQLGDTTKATPLTKDLRAACAVQFTRMAGLLNGLGS